MKNLYPDDSNESTSKRKTIVTIVLILATGLFVFISFFVSISNGNNVKGGKIEGKFSKEVFSNHSFRFDALYGSSVFEFKSNSTFTVVYKTGETYRGTFEVYNSTAIANKAKEIKADTALKYGKELSENIVKVSTAMMSDVKNKQDVYLLWLITDKGIKRPFLVKYDPSKNAGIAVDVLEPEQGDFILEKGA